MTGTIQADKKILTQDDLQAKVAIIVGTRPGIVMLAPIIKAIIRLQIPHIVIHTGQHYSPNMDAQFFDDLELPEPTYKLANVSAKTTHGGQTAMMLEGIETILLQERPRLVLVGGDANTNLAGALAARKLQIAVGHIEAGERSYDWRMPEEHNRRILDHISEYLFATGEKAKTQLLAEAVRGEIIISGNPIVDASLQHIDISKRKSSILEDLAIAPKSYAVLTTHREENVDNPNILQNSLTGVSQAAQLLGLSVIFTIHPRTEKRLKAFNLWDWANQLAMMRITPALGYLDFLNLLANAKLVFTDSGGVQQEACIHQIPAVTLRENTEWVETLELGANRLAGSDIEKIKIAALAALNGPKSWPIPFGDGATAELIAKKAQAIISQPLTLPK